MATKAKGIRISDELEHEIARESKIRGKSWSAITKELLEEAIRMRRAPGIAFMDGPAGRRAVVAGTGLDIWEIIATWRDVNGKYEALQKNFPWLQDSQLRSALAYYELYPSEIDARLEDEEQWTPEKVWAEFPFSRPRSR
jgi:uncharacterized protein (DUF433 family)